MFRKIKRLALAAGLLGAGAFVLTGTKIGAYARGAADWAKHSVGEQVPVELDIRAARAMLHDLDRKMETAIRAVVGEKHAVNKLDDSFAQRAKDLADAKDKIVALRKELDVTPATFTPRDAKHREARLAALFSSFEIKEATHRIEGGTLEARRNGLAAANLKVENLKTQREQLTARIEAIDVRRKVMEAEKVAQRVEIDDSEIAGLKNLMNEIETKLAVDSEVAERLDELRGDAKVPAAPTAEDVRKKVDAKFGNTPKVKGTSSTAL